MSSGDDGKPEQGLAVGSGVAAVSMLQARRDLGGGETSPGAGAATQPRRFDNSDIAAVDSLLEDLERWKRERTELYAQEMARQRERQRELEMPATTTTVAAPSPTPAVAEAAATKHNWKSEFERSRLQAEARMPLSDSDRTRLRSEPPSSMSPEEWQEYLARHLREERLAAMRLGDAEEPAGPHVQDWQSFVTDVDEILRRDSGDDAGE